MHVTKPTVMCEDNMSVVVNRENPGSKLSHKSMALSCHFVREHSYVDVVEIRKIGSNENISDTLTKRLNSSGFNNFIIPVMIN